MDNLQSQKDEITALRAIFEEQDILRINNKQFSEMLKKFSQDSPVDERKISAVSGDLSVSPAAHSMIHIRDEEQTQIVEYLPPVVLGFQLPQDYPETSAPVFKLSSKWLSRKKLSKLCRRLDEIWESNFGVEILYLWYDFLFDQSLDHLGISDTIELNKIHEPAEDGQPVDHRTIQESSNTREVITYMLEYDKQRKQMVFERSGWFCDICLSDKPGSQCFQVTDCKHTFCRSCMREFLKIKIKDGDVNRLECPTDQCESAVYPHQVKALVGISLYERYEQLLLKISIDSMGDIIYCPRNFCQSPVILDTPDEVLAQCPSCFFAFCTKCKCSYHAPMPCNISNEELKKKLVDATDAELEAYKEKYSEEFVRVLMNECASMNWMDENAKHCPECNIPISKLDGCNKMTCYRCRCYFCWNCEMILPRYNPYVHFQKLRGQTQACFLFPGEEDIDIVFQEDNEAGNINL